MKYEKRFEAREVGQATVGAKVEGSVWRVYDYNVKGWWKNHQNQPMDVVQATLIADSLNNGHIKP